MQCPLYDGVTMVHAARRARALMWAKEPTSFRPYSCSTPFCRPQGHKSQKSAPSPDVEFMWQSEYARNIVGNAKSRPVAGPPMGYPMTSPRPNPSAHTGWTVDWWRSWWQMVRNRVWSIWHDRKCPQNRGVEKHKRGNKTGSHRLISFPFGIRPGDGRTQKCIE